MLHASIGHTHVESFLSTIEVPTPHHKSLKDREREVYPHIRNVATASCRQALKEEQCKAQEEMNR